MPFLEWNDSYSVKVEELDKQHQKLVDTINMFHEALASGKGAKVLDEVLDKLIEYSRHHFACEENYMTYYPYARYETHKEHHQHFIDKIASFTYQTPDKKITQAIKLQNFLRTWLCSHVLHEDKLYSDFFNEHGLK